MTYRQLSKALKRSQKKIPTPEHGAYSAPYASSRCFYSNPDHAWLSHLSCPQCLCSPALFHHKCSGPFSVVPGWNLTSSLQPWSPVLKSPSAALFPGPPSWSPSLWALHKAAVRLSAGLGLSRYVVSSCSTAVCIAHSTRPSVCPQQPLHKCLLNFLKSNQGPNKITLLLIEGEFASRSLKNCHWLRERRNTVKSDRDKRGQHGLRTQWLWENYCIRVTTSSGKGNWS